MGRTIHAIEAGAIVQEKRKVGVRVQAEGEVISTEAAAHTESGLEARVQETEAVGVSGTKEMTASVLAEQTTQMLKGDTHPTCRNPSKTVLRGSLEVRTVHTVRNISTALRRKAPNTKNTNTRSTRASHITQIQRMATEKGELCVPECWCVRVCVCKCGVRGKI